MNERQKFIDEVEEHMSPFMDLIMQYFDNEGISAACMMAILGSSYAKFFALSQVTEEGFDKSFTHIKSVFLNYKKQCSKALEEEAKESLRE